MKKKSSEKILQNTFETYAFFRNIKVMVDYGRIT